ncbi:MAG: bifunctional UDP-N-acetylmuramoyl-tripeptide:D-alanyl-D-alanine ligase/alanine racemase [Bacteroidetes bacterium]|nr:bifunctional UDP-N-acetylmuramoyl-tripeptide:D-alanyl-D-alanine ligase/alanine racemase [Bacteroidota bacterium]
MNYTIKEIAAITNSAFIGDENVKIKKIAFDSRTIFSVENVAFVAINTKQNSGEKFILSSIEKGIKIIIAEKRTNFIEGISWILVENSIEFLQKLAQYHLQQFPSLETIGITGSNGKTIIKEWLFQCLSDDYKTVKSPKSFNSQIGLPISLLEITKEHEIGIFEVGISLKKEMEKLESIFSPKIGILSHIGSAHIENFDDETDLIQEKIKLFQQSELIIYNGDNPMVVSEIKKQFPGKKTISFGLNHHCDIYIINDWSNYSVDIQIYCMGEIFSIPVQKRDTATLSNALAVIAVLKHLGFENAKIIEKINALKSVEMRLESIEGTNGNILINDSYNLDLDSLIIAYQAINEYKKQKKILVITDFAEGKDKSTIYSDVVKMTNEQKFDKIFIIGKELSKYQHLFSTDTYTFDNTSELIDNQKFNQIQNAIILLKGARKFEIETLKNYLELQKHDTVLEVNLNAILHNIRVHKSFLKPSTKMMAMVKAYSYGLGGYEIAEFLQHHHIDYLGVAFADEGVQLRKNGITIPIVVMNPEQHSYQTIIDYNLEPEIYSFRVLDLFYEQLKSVGFVGKYPIHIKLETGMHRLGFKENEIEKLIEKLDTMDLKVMSIFSHLSSSDISSEKEFTLSQITTFQRISDSLMNGLNYKPIRHILNSAGIINYPEYQFDMVRIGIGMMGISGDLSFKNKLQRVVCFKTVISQISSVEKNESVGYNRSYKTKDITKIATIPVGYADGIPRLIGNMVGKMGINNQLVPIIGNVCMDMLMLDISGIEAKEGDEVCIFNGNPSLENFSEFCNTIPYEVLTSISRRVKRIYIKN